MKLGIALGHFGGYSYCLASLKLFLFNTGCINICFSISETNDAVANDAKDSDALPTVAIIMFFYIATLSWLGYLDMFKS